MRPRRPNENIRARAGLTLLLIGSSATLSLAGKWDPPEIQAFQFAATSNSVSLTYHATPGLLYGVESNATLVTSDWAALSALPLEATSTVDTVTTAVSGLDPTRFFRVRASAPALTSGATNTTVNGNTNVSAKLFTWVDAKGWKRRALMLNQTATQAGVLRQFSYLTAHSTRVCSAVPANGNAIQGMGYVVNHLGINPPWGNWSSGVSGSTTNILTGRHHLIIQYSLPAYKLSGKTIPTYVQWFFATGRSHPLFHVTQDARAHTAGNIGGDTRSPYGTMNFAGDGRSFPLPDDYKIGGVSWGDTYKFYTVQSNTTQESLTLLASSGWIYDETNSIPYAMAWMSAANAEQGTVATTSIGQHDHGSDPRIYPHTGFGKNQRALNGPMVRGDDWAYQMMNYPDIPATGAYDTKIGWGANFGTLGGFDNWGATNLNNTEVSLHRNSVEPWTGGRTNGLFLAYSTLIVFGEHVGGVQSGSTGEAVREMENTQAATLIAGVGTVTTQGSASRSVTNAPVRVYSPPGYNPMYAVWEASASSNAVDLTLTPAGGKPLTNPIFRIATFTSGSLPTVCLNGQRATADSDYFATLDTGHQELWLTLNREVESAVRLSFSLNP